MKHDEEVRRTINQVNDAERVNATVVLEKYYKSSPTKGTASAVPKVSEDELIDAFTFDSPSRKPIDAKQDPGLNKLYDILSNLQSRESREHQTKQMEEMRTALGTALVKTLKTKAHEHVSGRTTPS